MRMSFPDVTRFDELFEAHAKYVHQDKARWPRIQLRPKSRALVASIGEYCAIEKPLGHGSLRVRPTAAVVERIRRDAAVDDAGPIYFRIIVRPDGAALVTWSYQSIIGGRWLAEIDPKTIPQEAFSHG